MTNAMWGFIAFFAMMQITQVILLVSIFGALDHIAWRWYLDEENPLAQWLHSQELPDA